MNNNLKRTIIQRSFNVLPSELVTANIDEYELFSKEYDNSDKYRLIFTVNPICSNILFNRLTEFVINEGAYNVSCLNFSLNQIDGKALGSLSLNNAFKDYNNEYVRRDKLSLLDLVADTSYNHEKLGNVTYFCGYDIFNNRILREKTFSIVNYISNIKQHDNAYRKNFNTLSDYVRDSYGSDVRFYDMTDTRQINTLDKKHLYVSDSVWSFHESINENLTEVDGWIGFLNKGVLNIENVDFTANSNAYHVISNKIINTRNIGDFIDMYPDRTLFSAQPKYNDKMHRLEHNWEYCLTYPSENVYDNPIISDVDNGIVLFNGPKCLFKLTETLSMGPNVDNSLVTLRTYIKHGLNVGDKIRLYFKFQNSNGISLNDITVFGVGSGKYEREHYFSVRASDLYSILLKVIETLRTGGINTPKEVIEIEETINNVNMQFNTEYFAISPTFFEDNNVEFRFAKINNKKLSKYYIRKFKKLKKQDGSDYDITINKLAFAKNIYSDDISECLIDSIIDTSNIYDNLGRKLTELFVTVVKTNKGHDIWYNKNKWNSSTGQLSSSNSLLVEYSHCFGKLTDGFNLVNDQECYDYNVHYFHNIKKPLNAENKFNFTQAKTLSGKDSNGENKNITITDNVFYGDIVELYENGLEETVLEDVYFRFNTAQREYSGEEFKTLYYSEINSDDYDIKVSKDEVGNNDFLVTNDIRQSDENANEKLENYYINLAPEGYYYKPHHRILLKEYDDVVYYDHDTKITVKSVTRTTFVDENKTVNGFILDFDKTYYLINGDSVYTLNKNTGNMTYYTVTGITNANQTWCRIITNDNIVIDNTNNLFFAVNLTKPDSVYNCNDGTGRYLWKDVKSVNDYFNEDPLYTRPFTNGTHYLNLDIKLYVRRQDPFGLYGLSFNVDAPLFEQSMLVMGNEKDIDYNIYYKNEVPQIC
jgi:hypothetical protein